MSSNLDFAIVPEGVTGIDPNHPARNRNIRVLDSEAGLIEGTRTKLAIVGFATSTRDLAPFGDDTYDVVGLNALFRFIPRADFWCDAHENWDQENPDGVDYPAGLRACDVPILMNRTRPELASSVRLPIEHMIDLGADYFTSTVALLIAWAIFMKYREIALFGIDLVVGTEYLEQRQCAEFWLGVAHGRGVTIRLPQQSALLKHSHRYGFELEPSVGLIPLGDFAHREKALIAQRDQLMAKLNALDGAIHDVSQYETWKDDPAKRLAWLNEVKQETSGRLGAIDGACQETRFWSDLILLRSRGASIPIR